MYGMDLETDGDAVALGTEDYCAVDDLDKTNYAGAIIGGISGAVAGVAIAPTVNYVANETMWAVTNPGWHPPDWQMWKDITYLAMLPQAALASSVSGSVIGAYMGDRFLGDHEGGERPAEDADLPVYIM